MSWLSDVLERGGKTPDHRAYLRRVRLARLAVIAAQIGLLLAVTFGWEIAADRKWIDSFLTSQPSRVWKTLLRMAGDGSLFKHIWVTLAETLVALAVGISSGVAAAVALWWSDFLSRVLDPYLVMLNSLPKIALGPIFYIWLGDRLSIYGMAISISVIVSVIMILTGFRGVNENYVKLLRSLGATRWQILTKAVIPASVPTIIASLKVNVGLTLVGVIVGEFISSKAGLGYLIIYGGQTFNLDLVMTSVLLLALASAALYPLVGLVELLMTRRRTIEKKPDG